MLTKRNAMLEFLQASQGPQTGPHLISIGVWACQKLPRGVASRS